tara:strand:+ start:370 stop:543 length:174 start_codon:yes stop_codon:yes gene_type:complete
MGGVIGCSDFFIDMKTKQPDRSRFHPNNMRQRLGYRNGSLVVIAVYYPLQKKWKTFN